MLGKLICCTALALSLAVPALAESTSQPLIFASGATGTATSGQIAGQDTADYTLEGEAGHVLTVKMSTDNPSSYFNIYAPGDTPEASQAMFIGSTSGHSAELTLPSSGTYLIRTYLMPGAGRDGETARFSLTVDIIGRAPQSSDMTDSLNSTTPVSGPGYWQVTGITGALNIRAEPSTSARVAGAVPAGTVLRNGGCETAGDRNWCKVESTSGTAVSGWAASDFLTESAAPAASETAAPPAPAADDGHEDTMAAPAPQSRPAPAERPLTEAAEPAATSPVPPANPGVSSAKPAPKPSRSGAATGTLPCSVVLGMPTRDCAFSVTRSGAGNATLTIDWPGDGQREIRFENGVPVAPDNLTHERRGDLRVVNIGNERYEIPDAVVLGG
ncbi:MAG: SH3 domain-containing protein [Paracoccus sp. (in: a-proteobacteria)]